MWLTILETAIAGAGFGGVMGGAISTVGALKSGLTAAALEGAVMRGTAIGTIAGGSGGALLGAAEETRKRRYDR